MYSDYGPSEGRSSGETVRPTRPAASKPTVPASKPVALKPAPKKEVGESVSVNQPRNKEVGESVSVNEPKKREETNIPVDETKLSLSERMKLSRARNKAGSGPTDKRSVNERIREKLGFKKGGSVSSASRRADGIATKGKTKGRLI